MPISHNKILCRLEGGGRPSLIDRPDGAVAGLPPGSDPPSMMMTLMVLA